MSAPHAKHTHTLTLATGDRTKDRTTSARSTVVWLVRVSAARACCTTLARRSYNKCLCLWNRAFGQATRCVYYTHFHNFPIPLRPSPVVECTRAGPRSSPASRNGFGERWCRGGRGGGPGVNKRPVLGGVNGHAFYICVRCSRLCSACARICVFVLSHKHTHAHIQCCRYVHNMSLRFVCCCPIGRARMRTARAQTCRILITCIKYDVAQNNARRGFVCNKRK